MGQAGRGLESGVVRLERVGIEYRFGRSVGVGGVSLADVQGQAAAAERAAGAFRALVETGESPGMDEAVLWPRLACGEGESRAAIDAWAREARAADVLVSIGIGGSYLGNRVLRDALLGPSFNLLPREARGDVPELHFAGFHLDPQEHRALIEVLRAKAAGLGRPLRAHLLAISKSGTTTETLATTLALRSALEGLPEVETELTVLTDPTSVLARLAGSIRETGGRANLLPFPEGMGGRWSVMSAVGLVTAAASGVDLDALLGGARDVRDDLLAAGGDLSRNPALLYATLHHLHGQRGRTGAVFMPYAERLRCVSEWYVQLLAESLGKARDRQGREVHAGRTPIVAVGTTDMHAQTQLHQEGPRDKTVTTLDVRDWGSPTAADRVPDDPQAGKLAGKAFSALNTLAREANEEALASSDRPSDAFVLERLDARTVGGLLYLLMASVSYEGELLDVCAYDQPGVEAYKKIMKARL